MNTAMKKLLIIFFCLLLTTNCYAKWTKVHENNDFFEYFELDSARKKDGLVYLWSLIDFKKKQTDGTLSIKYYTKYNCEEMKFKVLSIIEYNTNMGKGRNFKYKKNSFEVSADTDWVYPLRESRDLKKLNIICKI